MPFTPVNKMDSYFETKNWQKKILVDWRMTLKHLRFDHRIMLERQHLTVRDYNKDQKAYASMLNKMYVAAKEGEEAFAICF